MKALQCTATVHALRTLCNGLQRHPVQRPETRANPSVAACNARMQQGTA